MADALMILSNVCKVLFWLVYTVYCWLEVLVLTLVPRSYRRKDIKANIVLVTGGGSGIGRLMCLKMAARGALIVTWDVSQKGNDETVRQVLASGGKCWSYTVDITDRQAVYTTAVKVKQQVGKVDILINNAGVVTGKKLLDCPDEAILKTFQVNSISHFWTTKAFLPDMMMTDKGHIVTIASMAGKSGLSGLVDYCSSKFAAVGFDESLRLELLSQKKYGIKTTVVCPVQIDTGMFQGFGTSTGVFVDMLDPDWVAEEVVDAILMNQPIIILPAYLQAAIILAMFLPSKSHYYLGQLMGADNMMDNFVGRKKVK
ncbi:hypothetical protein Pmani_016887 [Petrolisthes manimaculis]|uniref:Epidermal retinol dehydrogenase 2-like n=1 Tax=Petrolisthes manimaculis TaxID=1843537 RepID=A0AAE1UA08_9EUCA|nr:hypothetical protein Pmani_016887 [Petrolisthes manimaculis]KAK4311631.1 hypothetical protein Pmani_016887 [Petrolisthes manimaculis]